ncbi:hypothetical protein [Azospirillum halopraeferens]|uniref:hypothetical protein n=1 Tax=Azospirillum halopraeferens TaxID=34010 RepID=UPI00042190D6|nr:hypothetical protein [Azospirillum halopraeferens]
MVRLLTVALAGLLAVSAPAAAVEAMKPDRPERDHMGGLLRPPPDRPERPPLRPRFARAQVVYRLPMAIPEVATADPTLSRLCRLGAFIQEVNGFYWARTPGRSYGVAFSGGANLVDPQNRRLPGKVYFFQDPDVRCTVWVADQAAVMDHYVGP